MVETMYDLQFEDANRTTWFLVRQVNKLMSRTLESRLRKQRINAEQLIVLWIYRDYPGQKTLAEVSRLMSLTNQTMTGLINRMETDGLVRRVPRRKGKPFTEVKVTAKGEETCGRGVPLLEEAFKGARNWVAASQVGILNILLRALRDGLADDLHIEVESVGGWDKAQT